MLMNTSYKTVKQQQGYYLLHTVSASENNPVQKNLRFFKYSEIHDADTLYDFKSSVERSVSFAIFNGKILIQTTVRYLAFFT